MVGCPPGKPVWPGGCGRRDSCLLLPPWTGSVICFQVVWMRMMYPMSPPRIRQIIPVTRLSFFTYIPLYSLFKIGTAILYGSDEKSLTAGLAGCQGERAGEGKS